MPLLSRKVRSALSIHITFGRIDVLARQIVLEIVPILVVAVAIDRAKIAIGSVSREACNGSGPYGQGRGHHRR